MHLQTTEQMATFKISSEKLRIVDNSVQRMQLFCSLDGEKWRSLPRPSMAILFPCLTCPSFPDLPRCLHISNYPITFTSRLPNSKMSQLLDQVCDAVTITPIKKHSRLKVLQNICPGSSGRIWTI